MFDTFIKVVLTDLAFYQNIGLLLFATILVLLIKTPRKYQPLYYFSELAKKFAVKVNHPQRSNKQRAIAGTLAAIILVLPIWFVTVFFIELAAFPIFFELILLLICLTDTSFVKESKEIAVLIHKKDTDKTKAKLAFWCQRDTSTLSLVGLTKASIEKMVQMSSITYGLVMFSFLLGGINAAIFATLLKQLDYAWPQANPHYKAFAAFPFIINKIVGFIPYCCFLLFYSLSSTKTLAKLLSAATFKAAPVSNSLALELTAIKLNVELGGPRIYGPLKHMTPKYNYGLNPTAEHIVSTQQKLGSVNVIFIALLMSYIFIHFALALT